MTRVYHLKTQKRTFTVEITEEPTRVVVNLKATKYGDLGDGEELQRFLLPLFQKYDSDKRPVVTSNKFTGEVATIYGDANHHIAFVSPPKFS